MTEPLSKLDQLIQDQKKQEIISAFENMPAIGKTVGRVYLALHAIWNKTQNDPALQELFIHRGTLIMPQMATKTSPAKIYTTFITDRARHTDKLLLAYNENIEPVLTQIAQINQSAAYQLAHTTLNMLIEKPVQRQAFIEACAQIAPAMLDAPMRPLNQYVRLMLKLAEKNIVLRDKIVDGILPCIEKINAQMPLAGMLFAEQVIALATTDANIQNKIFQTPADKALGKLFKAAADKSAKDIVIPSQPTPNNGVTKAPPRNDK